MDISLLIKQRLTDLGLDQKELAAAAQVTESYISQLLARKKAPPAPGRTDIYEKIGQHLGLPAGELARLAEVQRQLELKKKIAEPPAPLFQACRDLMLRKCRSESRPEVRRIVEKEPFGEVERLVTQKILDVTQSVVREELRNEAWLHSLAGSTWRTFEQTRVALLEFLDTDIFHISVENCEAFLDPIIDSWSIDMKTFGLTIVLNPRLAPGGTKCFEFIEKPEEPQREPGYEQFLQDKTLSGDATADELDFLARLRFPKRKPTALYYYRELQNLRDPLHFRAAPSTSS